MKKFTINNIKKVCLSGRQGFCKKYCFVFGLLFMGMIPLRAQDIGLSMMNNLWQTNTLNPSKMTDRKFIFSFPGVSASMGTSGLTYNNITSTNAEGKTVIVANDLIERLNNKNTVWANTDFETFHVAFGSGRWQVSVGHAFKTNTSFTFPKELAQLALQGNAQFLGQTVNIAPEFNTSTYGEWSIGTAINYDRFTFGARLKMLGGLSNFSSGNAVASVYTDDASVYELTLASDYTINSAGLIDVSGLEGDGGELEITTTDMDFLDAFFGQNKGLAIDLGATFKVNDKLEFSGSILDIGSINWKENAKVYTSEGTYEYKGLDLLNLVESENADFSQIADTLSDIFQFSKADKSYRTALSWRTYWTVSYQIFEKFRVGGLIHTRRLKGNFDPTVAVNAAVDFGRWWTLGTNLSHGKSTGLALGANTAVRLGPVQLFFATDNLPALFNIVDNSYAHARLGMNLGFGKRSE